jgi:hypothetical protein
VAADHPVDPAELQRLGLYPFAPAGGQRFEEFDEPRALFLLDRTP